MTALETVKKNLSLLHGETARLSEKTLYELSELSDVVYQRIGHRLHGEEAEMLLHRGWTEQFLFEDLSEGVPDAYLPLLTQKGTLDRALDLCAFSLFLAARIRDGGERRLPWEERPISRTRIAYVPSGKAEQAYFALASLRGNASVLYATSTQDAVNALLSKEADFAMLPYLSASGERISGVDRLCAQNDLSLCARIAVPEREDTLVYALFATKVSPYAKTDEMALSLQITADSYAHLGRILSVIPVFGYDTASLFTESEEYGRVRAKAELLGTGDATALWIYLSLYSAGSTLLGRYPIIETKESEKL